MIRWSPLLVLALSTIAYTPPNYTALKSGTVATFPVIGGLQKQYFLLKYRGYDPTYQKTSGYVDVGFTFLSGDTVLGTFNVSDSPSAQSLDATDASGWVSCRMMVAKTDENPTKHFEEHKIIFGNETVTSYYDWKNAGNERNCEVLTPQWQNSVTNVTVLYKDDNPQNVKNGDGSFYFASILAKCREDPLTNRSFGMISVSGLPWAEGQSGYVTDNCLSGRLSGSKEIVCQGGFIQYTNPQDAPYCNDYCFEAPVVKHPLSISVVSYPALAGTTVSFLCTGRDYYLSGATTATCSDGVFRIKDNAASPTCITASTSCDFHALKQRYAGTAVVFFYDGVIVNGKVEVGFYLRVSCSGYQKLEGSRHFRCGPDGTFVFEDGEPRCIPTAERSGPKTGLVVGIIAGIVILAGGVIIFTYYCRHRHQPTLVTDYPSQRSLAESPRCVPGNQGSCLPGSGPPSYRTVMASVEPGTENTPPSLHLVRDSANPPPAYEDIIAKTERNRDESS